MKVYVQTCILFIVTAFFIYIIANNLIPKVEYFTSPMKTDYNIQYTPDGVKDIIKMTDSTNPYASVTYIDDITSIRPKTSCPTNYIKDSVLGCIPQCPQGYTYDTKIKSCVPICATHQQLKYVSDSSAICVSKCWDIQYYDLNSSKCVNCPIGYKGDGNNNCIALKPCSAGSVMVDNYGTCKSCPHGQTIDPKTFQCNPICKPFEKYNDDGTCTLQCPNQNQYYDPLYDQCISCPIGYLVNDQNQCVPRAPCPQGQFLDNAGINCVNECPVYDKYDPVTGTCKPICSGNTPIFNTLSLECVPCAANTIYSGSYNKCVPAPTPPPPTCAPGFTVVDNECQSLCPNWLINDPKDPRTCIPRCASKSQYFDDVNTYSCIDCPTGFTVDTFNKCTVPLPTSPPEPCKAGYIMNTTSNKCESICPPWRQNDPSNSLQCTLLCSDPSQYYDTVYNFGCTNCPPGFGVDNNNKCTIPLSKSTPSPAGSSLSTTDISSSTPSGSNGISSIAVSNVSVGNAFFDGNTVNVDIFTLDMSITVTFSNYNYATVTVGTNTKSTVASGKTTTLTFPGIQLIPSGIEASIKYYNTTNTDVNPIATDTYSIGYKSAQTVSRNYTIKPEDFAIGFLLIGGGAGGSIGS